MALFASCSGPQDSKPDDIVAVINGTNILASELDEAARPRLKRVEQDIYEIKRNALDDKIQEKLLEQAAAKENLGVDKYLEKNVDKKISPPTEEEIKQFYKARKDQIGAKTYEQMKDTISSFLVQDRQNTARQTLLAGLRSEAKIEVKLSPPRIEVEAGDSPYMGPKNAPVTVIEFTDYQCPFCGRVRPTVNQITSEYKDEVKYVIRDFPLSFHQYAKKAHEAAHCAGDQKKYWEYNKILFSDQNALQIEKLKKYASDLKLNTNKFNKCLDEGKFAKKVEEDIKVGIDAGVSGTPAFFVNGILVSGARPFSEFKRMIDEELKR